jgi:sRNA-binding carbon storage regulator CsrA
MLCLTSQVLRKDNAAEAEVIIDLRELGLGIVVLAPIQVSQRKKQVRIGYTADPRVKIYRRKVFEQLGE